MLNKRQMVILLNAVAIMTDKLAEDNQGQFPNSSYYEAAQQAEELVQACYDENPQLTFAELNDLVNTMILLINGQYNELAQLPPTVLQ